MNAIRVLLAEDHILVRSGIRLLLETVPGVRVVGEARTGREAIALALELYPDVVFMDITMPELNGIEATLQIKRQSPRCQVIILSVHSTEEYAVRALKAGATAYLVKDSALQEVELAIRSVLNGVTYLSPVISKQVVADYLRRLQSDGNTLELLTSRQREVLQLIAEGFTTKEIASKLGVSEKTIQTHRMQLMQKLGMHDVAALVRYAVKNGMVNLE